MTYVIQSLTWRVLLQARQNDPSDIVKQRVADIGLLLPSLVDAL
jgi:hypothetical protein